jgi:hypothetical protein
LRLLWAHLLWCSTLGGFLLDLFDDFTSAIGCQSELVFKFGLHGIKFLLLVALEAFNSLLDFLVVCFCFFLILILERRLTSKLTFNLSFCRVELVLVLLNLRLDDLLNLLIV